ncbi:MAG: Fe-S oxidoreductase [Gemmataceae bacterium]|jgi:NAD-dependent dihydropyrimidine dehydrogenase PreA subunit|uniref:Ferredoxin family protein n=1 Tax=Thermogemmata fonticola TaxID=2755323 RepID=A0A7V8VCC0_9BACT|nr:ferredoxin family protein [Thermogemmata fonticola]MBA2225422.1 ferredoxin family protein [Thermogemmata fonticola]GIW84720.1 MAG: Fe-S oxidoreductase [Gemmataceae bacterium]
MARNRLTIVISQSPGKHPAKRSLEEAIVAALLGRPEYEVAVVPNLYDLEPDHSGLLFLQAVRGDLVVLSWLYPRAAFWILDRHGIQGHFGKTQLGKAEEEASEEAEPSPSREAQDQTEAPEQAGIGPKGEIPSRWIYPVDLREAERAEEVLAEIERIAEECQQRQAKDATKDAVGAAPPVWVSLGLALQWNGTATPNGTVHPFSEPPANSVHPPPEAGSMTAATFLEPTPRRWYPVIDYSRCTNCLECLDFCLFGVYGVDALERILVENPDQCKKGCPACSRVCPQQAIMFPEYKSPAIAGAEIGATGSVKIDLSKLFGGESGDALSLAVAERDRELINAGRQAVGMSVGIPKRQSHKTEQPKDELDKLVDDLDNLGL